jgi:hypothetical protein
LVQFKKQRGDPETVGISTLEEDLILNVFKFFDLDGVLSIHNTCKEFQRILLFQRGVYSFCPDMFWDQWRRFKYCPELTTFFAYNFEHHGLMNDPWYIERPLLTQPAHLGNEELCAAFFKRTEFMRLSECGIKRTEFMRLSECGNLALLKYFVEDHNKHTFPPQLVDLLNEMLDASIQQNDRDIVNYIVQELEHMPFCKYHYPLL